MVDKLQVLRYNEETFDKLNMKSCNFLISLHKYKSELHTDKNETQIEDAVATRLSIFHLAVNSTLFDGRAGDSSGEWIDSHPQQRKDRSKKNGPHYNNGGCSVLPTHETFEERVEMNDHPEGEE